MTNDTTTDQLDTSKNPVFPMRLVIARADGRQD